MLQAQRDALLDEIRVLEESMAFFDGLADMDLSFAEEESAEFE